MELGENVVVAGKFRLNRLLGRGGMGSVWQATHLALDIPCAVKFIEGDFAAVPEMQARFQREAKAAAALRSPHVVQILDHDIWEGMPYIAMELLDGQELSKRIASMGTLSPAETTVIIGQVCRALGKAHQQGIVHRDLKPDNLFLVHDDDRDIVKILDFGIAKSKNPNLDIGGNTKTGAMLGTPYYMSPEQAQGNKSIDGRSDLWALGVIVFECLTGKRPFESDALGDLLMQIMVKPLPLLSTARPGLPPTIDAWFAKACARDPNDRFQTAKELAEALGVALNVGAATEVMTAREVNAIVRGATLPLNTPNPMGSTPNPIAPNAQTGPGAPTPYAHATTIETPKKSALPIFIALGAIAVVGVVVVAVVATRSHTPAPSVATDTQTTATVAATATVTATANATITATATAAATATETPATSATVAAVTTPPTNTHVRTNASAKPGASTHPPSVHTTGTDLGF
jgi:serine/threonine-protein kinase